MSIANPALLAAGAVVFLIGVWCWRWSSRHAIDLKGAAVGAAWQSARNRQMPNVPDDLKARYREIADETSNVRRAQKAGGTVVRHFLAQALGIVGLIGLIAGLALMAAGIWWK